jgi:magnesium transporter
VLTIYNTTEQGQEIIEHPVTGCWIDAVDPTQEEITTLEEWGIEPELITYSLDLDEIARVEREPNEYTLILLRIPYDQDESEDILYITFPMGIILKENMIVTISKFNNAVLSSIHDGKFKGMKTGKRYRFVLYTLFETANKYLADLREINNKVDLLQEKLQKSTRNKEVLELLKFQKSVVYFKTGLHSNQVMMERLQRMQMFNQYEEDQDLLEDVLTENQQALQMVNISADILSSMMDAFASIIGNNLNAVMKALAAITIIISLPTIVASFFGMNVNVPFSENEWGFFFVVLVAFVIMGIAIWIFIRRDWF